jgi:hypothetical protein
MDQNTVIVAEPTPDGAVCAVLAARACRTPRRTFLLPSPELLDFFAHSTQRDLPRVYSLVICGLGLVHTSWDGRLLRPHVVQALRDFARPVRWFSNREWEPDDRIAVQNIIGEDRLTVDPSAPSSAKLVRAYYSDPDPDYADTLVQLAGSEEEATVEWTPRWRRIISSLKDDPARLSPAVQPLIDGEPEDIPGDLLDRAERIEQGNRELASENASDPVPMRDYTLTRIDIPPDRHAFWREISAFARSARGVDFSLCRLLRRPVLVLSRGEDIRKDLRRWVRYVTDVVPAASAVEPRPDAVPLFVEGLTEDPGLADDVVRALQDGSHLLDA